MRIPRLYTPQPLMVNETIILTDQAAHYLVKVLRMEAGRECLLFNGDNHVYQATLTAANKKNVTCHIHTVEPSHTQSPLHLELAIGLSKGDRMDWVCQKATELGVSRIVPIFAARSELKLKGERLEKKRQHWQQIVVSACEQCRLDVVPEIAAPQTLDAYLSQASGEHKFVLHHRTDKSLESLNKPASASLLIGPEGGLNEDEIALAEQHGFIPLALGPRVLRTETAPLAAISIMQYLWGDMA